ncbi:biotin transporter BioY [Lacticaseibacillus porcinae]|uniref:biotin transporter BioY n=1 Tax=Lacticaseibacillus porcinae TaxID=1123687 RepID=UPI000F792C8C|nr:biotin transporter BioY [Lacticaseibacillus porcinae]
MGQKATLKNLMQAAMVCALLIILGLFPGIPLGIIPVAVVLQNLGVMLAGEILPARYGTLAVGVFLLLVALGLPFLSGGRGGIAIIAGPTGGYLIAWVLAPALNAWLLHITGAAHKPAWQEFCWATIFLVVFVDAIGSIWLSVQSHMPLTAALASNVMFVPGDLLKLGFAVMIARRLRKVLH